MGVFANPKLAKPQSSAKITLKARSEEHIARSHYLLRHAIITQSFDVIRLIV